MVAGLRLRLLITQFHIDKIREDYERAWESSRVQERQMGVALYFIDKLALRAGHEKDDDEADTVGCCNLKVPPNYLLCAWLPFCCQLHRQDVCQGTLGFLVIACAAAWQLKAAHLMHLPMWAVATKNGKKVEVALLAAGQVENVECLAHNHIKFDFLGKDSIRYENEVAVEPRVWQLVKQFCRGDKKAGARTGGACLCGDTSTCRPLCALYSLSEGASHLHTWRPDCQYYNELPSVPSVERVAAYYPGMLSLMRQRKG